MYAVAIFHGIEQVINQDLRDPLPLEDHDDHQDQHDPDRRLFDLITGTPPYIPQVSHRCSKQYTCG